MPDRYFEETEIIGVTEYEFSTNRACNSALRFIIMVEFFNIGPVEPVTGGIKRHLGREYVINIRYAPDFGLNVVPVLIKRTVTHIKSKDMLKFITRKRTVRHGRGCNHRYGSVQGHYRDGYLYCKKRIFEQVPLSL